MKEKENETVRPIRYGSVCSGVEAASLAWSVLGWKAAFLAEVEPFPSAVLMERFNATKPMRPLDPMETDDERERKTRVQWAKDIAAFRDGGELVNFGDFTKITKDDLNGNTIDLLVGGCPCQDFSVAGKRMGLDGHRGSLSLEFIRLAYQLGARWVVFENVPGLLSQDDGRAFGSFLSGLSGCEITPPQDGWRNAGIVRNARRDRFGLAWRILDAQYARVDGFPFAVPQRRRRIFVVGYFGDWRRAAAVLFERDGVYRNTPPRRKTREEIAADAGRCAAFAGGAFFRGAAAGHAGDGGNGNPGAESGAETGDGNYADGTLLRTFRSSDHGHFVPTDTAGTVKRGAQSCGNSSTSLCVSAGKCRETNPDEPAQTMIAAHETGPGFWQEGNFAGCLRAEGENRPSRPSNIICAGFMGGQGAKAGGIGFGEQTSPTIKASPSGGNQIPDVVLSLAAAQAGELGCIGENISQTLSRNNGGFSYIAAVKNGEAEKKEPDIVCVHGSQDPICNTGHANAVNRNNGLENVICRATQQGNAECCKNCAPTITGAAGTSGNNQPVVFVQQNQVGEVRTGDVAGTINTNGNASGRNCPIVCTAEKGAAYSIGNGQVNEAESMQREVCQTLNCMHETQKILRVGDKMMSQYGEVAGTLEARHDSSPCADRGQNIVFSGCLNPHDPQTIRCYGTDGAFPALTANENGGQNRQSVFCYDMCRRDTVPREAKGVSPCITRGPQGGNNNLPVICYENHAQDSRVTELKDGVFPQINANAGMGGGNLPLVCYEHHPQDSRVKETDVNGTLGTFGNSVEGKDTIVQEAYAFDSLASNSMKSGNPVSGCRKIDCAKTIDTTPPDPTKNQGGMAIACYPINSMIIGKDAKDGDRQTTGIGNDKDPSPTIGTSQHHAVAIAENIIGRKVENGGNGVGAQEELAYTQNATGVMAVCTKGNGDAFESAVHTTISASGGGQLGQGSPAVRNGMSVRRLLPLETERLMGFPDNWTRIPWKGKPEEECPDAPRYKACGNSMCVNVMRWIGIRIQAVENAIADENAEKDNDFD